MKATCLAVFMVLCGAAGCGSPAEPASTSPSIVPSDRACAVSVALMHYLDPSDDTEKARARPCVNLIDAGSDTDAVVQWLQSRSVLAEAASSHAEPIAPDERAVYWTVSAVDINEADAQVYLRSDAGDLDGLYSDVFLERPGDSWLVVRSTLGVGR